MFSKTDARPCHFKNYLSVSTRLTISINYIQICLYKSSFIKNTTFFPLP